MNQRADNVLQYINANLTPKTKEKHAFGEVFTPLAAVDEMLSHLPSEVWSNPALKWLDPANGIGNFPIKVFLGLYEGLRDIFPDDDERSKHIIEKMLYMVDINVKNNETAKNLFQILCPTATPNIEQIDNDNGFLADTQMVFNGAAVDKFDIIMGNPPFNRGAIRTISETVKSRSAKVAAVGDAKSESGFWFKFVKKALAGGLLKPNGYLLFIHPITWFKPDRAGAHNMILSNQLDIIKIYKNDGASYRLFEGNAKISIAYYLLCNRLPEQKTTILYADYPDKKESMMLSTDSIILLNYNSIFEKIQKKIKLFGNGNGIHHRTQKLCDDTGPHKLITLLRVTGLVTYVYSSTPHIDQSSPKIILGGTSTPVILYDRDGEYGIYDNGNRTYFVGKGLDKINDYFKTKLSTLLLKYIKFDQDFIKPAYYPDVRLLPFDTINDDTLAEYFGFNENEIREISLMVQPIHATTAVQIHSSEIQKNKNKKV